MLSDIRFALRLLRKSPAFAITAVLSLALGIGATTTVFSAFRAVFLRPLPFADPDRLVEITKTGSDGAKFVTEADVRFWREFSHSFESFGTYAFYRPVTLMSGSEPTNLVARLVERDLFPTLGARPALGRLFADADFQNGRPQSVLLSTKVWRAQFGGDPNVVGRGVLLDGESYTVAGVMPEEFQFPSNFSLLWIPDRAPVGDPFTNRNAIARLKPGVSAEAAMAELERLRPALARVYPEAKRDWRIQLDSLAERDTRKYRAAFTMLCGAVGLLVLIACLNVANLILARSVSREGEFAVRGALGAARTRLMRQVLMESAVLAMAGGALGALLAYAGNRALVTWTPTHFQIGRLSETHVDLAVFGFAAALTMATALVFGLGPALVLSRFSLREMGRTTTHNASKIRWRGGLAIAEIALSLTLSIGAGLLLRSFVTLAKVDAGFRTDHVLSVTVPAGNQLKTSRG